VVRERDGVIRIAASGRFLGKKIKIPREQNGAVAAP
jgi:hypothetical protein